MGRMTPALRNKKKYLDATHVIKIPKKIREQNTRLPNGEPGIVLSKREIWTPYTTS